MTSRNPSGRAGARLSGAEVKLCLGTPQRLALIMGGVCVDCCLPLLRSGLQVSRLQERRGIMFMCVCGGGGD